MGLWDARATVGTAALARRRGLWRQPLRMKDNPSRSSRGPREVPLDHLQPGGRHPSDPTGDRTTAAGGTGPGAADPSEPTTPGRGEADAISGKATRSSAETATRPHLEGSEQSPM